MEAANESGHEGREEPEQRQDPQEANQLELDCARALRRGKRARLVGALAALLLLGSATAVGLVRAHDHPPQPVSSSAPARLSWAEGSVIHDGNAKLDVGRTVARYVRTTAGFVFTGPHGVVWSWKNGTATKVGHTPGPLFSAAGGPLAGWVGGNAQGGQLSFVVLNQATDQKQESPARWSPAFLVAPGELDGAGFVGLDGTSAWWLDGHNYYHATLTWSSHRSPADANPSQRLHLPPGHRLLAVSATVRVEQTDSGAFAVVRHGRPVDLGTAPRETALLAPDSRHIAFGTDEGRATAQVYRTDTGRHVRLEPTAWSALVTQWLTDHTVAVLVAARENDHYRLESCSVRTTHCTIAVPDLGSGPTTGPGNGLAFDVPTGDYWFPYLHG